MKKNLFLCFSILLTNFIFSQVTVNAPSSVEVGVNNNFGFTFLPKSSEYPSGSTSYKLTSWFINDGSSNMNNSGFGSYSNNSQSLNTYNIGQSQSLNFPIKWEDNSNSLTSNISIVANVSYYAVDTNGNTYLAGSRIHSITYAVNINRIFTPTISSPTILSCCSNLVTFSATNFGTANVFNWSISGGSFTGSGSSITVTPTAGNGSVFASCTVSRSLGLSTYTRSNSLTVNRTARTASFTGVYATANSGIDYICSGVGRQMSMPSQCGITTINWVAQGCTINGQGTLTPTITPLNTIATGTSIGIYATVTFDGGCIATTPITTFRVLDSVNPPLPTGYLKVTKTGSTLCTSETLDVSFVTTDGFNNGIVTSSPDFIWGPASGRRSINKKFTVCNKNLCTGISSCKDYFISSPPPCTGARMANFSYDTKLIIVPNPSNGNLKVSLPESISGIYQVYDQTNNLVQESKFDNQSEIQIDLSQKLRNGIYVLKVITENNTLTEKIILNK